MLSIRACDKGGCGNPSNVTVEVIVETNLSPEVEITFPVEGENYTSVSELRFIAVDDNATTMTCKYFLDDVKRGEEKVKNNTEKTIWIEVKTLGKHSVAIKCSDGAVWGRSTKTQFVLENTPPEIIIYKPREGTYNATKNVTLELEFEVKDTSNQNVSCSYTIDEKGWISLNVSLQPPQKVVKNITISVSAEEENHTILVRCVDEFKAESTSKRSFIVKKLVFYQPPQNESIGPTKKGGEENKTGGVLIKYLYRYVSRFVPPEILPFLILALIVIVILSVSFAAWYAKQKAKESAARKIVEEKLKERRNLLVNLKERREELRKEIGKLKEKEINVGLTPKERIKKETYEHELVKIQEKLLSMPEFIDELRRRADKAFRDAKWGVPSKDIIKQLREEGYSEKEISAIRMVFERKKKEWEKKTKS